MKPADVAALERATLKAVSPSKLDEIDGWLLGLDPGPMARARSAAPLTHQNGPKAIDAIEAAYWTEGMQPLFRLADGGGLASVHATLGKRGYETFQPTLVKVGDVETLARFRDAPGEVMERPDAAWGEVFLGEGFDPVEGAARVAALSRSEDALYGCIREDGRTVAVGVVSFGYGWAGIHGMRTAARCQGRGLASQVLAGLGRAIEARGIERVYLQVEEKNPARKLYRKAGFKAAWTYRYWRRPE